jgi:hypothetical protein
MPTDTPANSIGTTGTSGGTTGTSGGTTGTSSDTTGTSGGTPASSIDDFMLEEYKTIANAHFDLHSGLRQNFRFYLGIVAVPFTVTAVAFKDQTLSIFALPDVLTLLFTVTPAIGLLLFIHMINTRFDIILYTRTVNGVRDYFVSRSSTLGHTIPLTNYLKLPTNQFRPAYREGPSRAYWWLFCLVTLLNSVYAFIAAANFLVWCGAIMVGIVLFLLHGFLYYGFSSAREKKEIPEKAG